MKKWNRLKIVLKNRSTRVENNESIGEAIAELVSLKERGRERAFHKREIASFSWYGRNIARAGD